MPLCVGHEVAQVRQVGELLFFGPAALHAAEPLVDGTPLIDEGLGFSVDLRPGAGTGQGDLVGYRARPHTGVIDLDRIAAYDPRDFWDALRTTEARLRPAAT